MGIKLRGNTLTFAVWTLVTCAVHVVLFRGEVNMDLPAVQRIAMAVLAVVCILFVHEGIHYIFMKLFFRGKVRLVFVRDKLGIPTPGVQAEGHATKGQKIIVWLAPFWFLTVLPDVIFMFSPGIHLFFFIVAIGNCAGCFYDVMDVWMIMKKENA